MHVHEKQTVTEERDVLVRVVCNSCGETVQPEGYHTHVRQVGGYESPDLCDLSRYEFDLCEACLVRMMDGLKLPPEVVDVDPWDGEQDGPPRTYAEDRACKRRMSERMQKDTLDIDRLTSGGLCVHALRENDPDSPRCEQPAPILWHGRWRYCDLHGCDCYALHGTIERVGVTLTPEMRVAQLQTYQLELRERASSKSAFRPPTTDDERHLRTTLALVLIGTPRWRRIAQDELIGLVPAVPDRPAQWHYLRLPAVFGPDRIEEALEANRWLHWGANAGYRNAAAIAEYGQDTKLLFAEILGTERTSADEPSE